MKKIIHINQHIIKRNAKTGERNPVITCKTYNSNIYGHEVVIKDENGKTICKIKYSPNNPLSCGAVVWLETKARVEVKTVEETLK